MSNLFQQEYIKFKRRWSLLTAYAEVSNLVLTYAVLNEKQKIMLLQHITKELQNEDDEIPMEILNRVRALFNLDDKDLLFDYLLGGIN